MMIMQLEKGHHGDLEEKTQEGRNCRGEQR